MNTMGIEKTPDFVSHRKTVRFKDDNFTCFAEESSSVEAFCVDTEANLLKSPLTSPTKAILANSMANLMEELRSSLHSRMVQPKIENSDPNTNEIFAKKVYNISSSIIKNNQKPLSILKSKNNSDIINNNSSSLLNHSDNLEKVDLEKGNNIECPLKSTKNVSAKDLIEILSLEDGFVDNYLESIEVSFDPANLKTSWPWNSSLSAAFYNPKEEALVDIGDELEIESIYWEKRCYPELVLGKNYNYLKDQNNECGHFFVFCQKAL